MKVVFSVAEKIFVLNQGSLLAEEARPKSGRTPR